MDKAVYENDIVNLLHSGKTWFGEEYNSINESYDISFSFPNLVKDFYKNPTSNLAIMKCYPWTFEDKVALIGDSAHAIVPFYGQGMNAGFEDIYSLSRIMEQFGDDWEKIFQTFHVPLNHL